jgi:hypothetical protein
VGALTILNAKRAGVFFGPFALLVFGFFLYFEDLATLIKAALRTNRVGQSHFTTV